MTIDVPLVVSENQTLYLLVLGPKLNYDMSGVRTLDELKKWSFDYLINVEGHTQSLITADDEVPLAGEVSGVTVVDIDGGKRGLRIQQTGRVCRRHRNREVDGTRYLRYKFEVENYRLQGLKLLNVNNTIRLTNLKKIPMRIHTPHLKWISWVSPIQWLLLGNMVCSAESARDGYNYSK